MRSGASGAAGFGCCGYFGSGVLRCVSMGSAGSCCGGSCRGTLRAGRTSLLEFTGGTGPPGASTLPPSGTHANGQFDHFGVREFAPLVADPTAGIGQSCPRWATAPTEDCP